jgi:hypothetical protein
MKEKEVLKQIKDQKTAEYVLECIQKAKKWDKLGEEIKKLYVDEEGNIIEDESGDGLFTIGERASIAYGWL